MRRLTVALLVIAVAGALVGVGWWLAAADTQPPPPPPAPADLRADHASNPLGTDGQRPRLTWRLSDGTSGQLAVQVRVASDLAILAEGAGDVWDSGVVETDQLHLDYRGPALESATRYHWQVRVWDGNGRASSWSDAAYWETGILEEAEWEADWIGAPFERWPFEQGNPASAGLPAPLEPGSTYGQTFETRVPFDRVSAHLASPEDDAAALLTLHADGPEGPVVAETQDAVGEDAWLDLELGSDAEPGTYALVLQAASGAVTWRSHDDDLYPDGTALIDGAPVTGDRAFLVRTANAAQHQALPLLRHEFDLPDRDVARARLYLSGLGYNRTWLNGEPVAGEVVEPAFTDYSQRVPYTTYDVTGLVRPGGNAIGVALGSGWFGLNTPTSPGWHLAPWHGEPRVRLRLVVEYADGSSAVTTSSPAWRVAEGPTRRDSVYTGEVYDARLEQPGWTQPGFDDRDWQPARRMEAPAGGLVPQRVEPVRTVDTVEAVGVNEAATGVFVFDFGRVLAGRVRLVVRGPEGHEVRLTYGQQLDEDGRVVRGRERIDGPEQTDVYILRGGADEEWEPRFSIKGFRYVEVEGYPGTPGRGSLEGRSVHSTAAPAGRFETTDALLTEIHDSVRRSIAGNLQSVYTADPAHDRAPLIRGAELSAGAAMAQFDLVRFFAKWLDDIADAQRDDGALPPMAPAAHRRYGDPDPAQDAAFQLIAYELYRRTGDERLLRRHYERFGAYLDYLAETADGHIVRTGQGDWSPPGHEGGVAPEGAALVSTAYYFHLARTLSEIADVLGEEVDAQRHWTQAEEIRAAFNAEFLDQSGPLYRTDRPVGFRQTSQIIPLAFGLVPDDERAAVLRRLVDDLAAREGRLDTGAVGTRHLLPVLTEHGAVDLAYRVATQTAYPSWGHWIEHGATGMLGDWDPKSPSQGSHALASIGAWLYEELAGVTPLEPGYERVRIRPRVPTGLAHVRASVATPRGAVGVAWEQDEERLLLRVSVPPGATAEAHVPAATLADVRESGQAITWRHPHARFDRMERGAAVFEVQPGAYEFTVRRG